MSNDEPRPIEQSTLGGIRQPVRQDELAFDIVRPFGPSILEAELPPDILGKMLDLSDHILTDAKRESWGRYLVGQIREEPRIPEEIFAEFGVLDYLKRQFAEYVIACIYCNSNPEYKRGVDQLKASGQYRNPTSVQIESAWVVSQQPGEYNPIHNHSMATMASVMYLKVPEDMQKNPIPDKVATDGCIEFVDRSVGDSLLTLQTSSVRVTPAVGCFYIFPSSLLHLVYPFQGDSERRSMAINASHRIG